METHQQTKFTLNTGTDLAFALVVFISYFASFSNALIISPFIIVVVIILGVAYITNGIYGFSYVNRIGTNRAKILYFLLQIVIGGLIVFYGKGAGFNALILLPLVAHTAMTLDQDMVLVANAGIILTYIISVLAYSHSLQVVWSGAPIFFAGQVFILIFTQTAVTEQRARLKLETLADQLSEANRQLSEYATKVKELTITQERNRMAREIHDGLGHYLTSINMQIKAVKAIFKNDENKADHLLNIAQDLTSEALVDVRNSVFALRQGSESESSLIDRINMLATGAGSSDREIAVKLIGTPKEISPQVDLTIFRAAQESINNSTKHSGAKHLLIELDFSKSKNVTLITRDDGIGSDRYDFGFGLIGIQERVRLLNGSVEFTTSTGKGFEIKITLPRNNEH